MKEQLKTARTTIGKLATQLILGSAGIAIILTPSVPLAKLLFKYTLLLWNLI